MGAVTGRRGRDQSPAGGDESGVPGCRGGEERDRAVEGGSVRCRCGAGGEEEEERVDGGDGGGGFCECWLGAGCGEAGPLGRGCK